MLHAETIVIEGLSHDEASTEIKTATGIWRFCAPESFGIPDHCAFSLVLWVINRHPVGDFLRAVLSNNLIEAALRADKTNRDCLHAYAEWLWNNAPDGCYGSVAKFDSWLGLNHKG